MARWNLTARLLLPCLALAAAPSAEAAAPHPAVPAAGSGWHRVQQPQTDTRAVMRISREQAVAAATKVVPGQVTSVDLERKGGRVVWVVEVQPPNGDETDVLVDIETGEVLGIEK